jgi:hypothetical protein
MNTNKLTDSNFPPAGECLGGADGPCSGGAAAPTDQLFELTFFIGRPIWRSRAPVPELLFQLARDVGGEFVDVGVALRAGEVGAHRDFDVSALASSSHAYWKPEQPPPEIEMRSPATGVSEPLMNFSTAESALGVRVNMVCLLGGVKGTHLASRKARANADADGKRLFCQPNVARFRPTPVCGTPPESGLVGFATTRL